MNSTPSPMRFSALQLAELLGQHPPTPEQAAVIEAPIAPMLVVAGAGSGKTETMAGRVLWLIANEIVEPRQILGLTFTRKAAHELSERIGSRLAALAGALREEGIALPPGLERGEDDLVGQRPLVHTYNGFALDLVLEHGLAIGLDPSATMMSTSASWQMVHDIVEGWDDSLALSASPATVAAAVSSLSSSLADHLVSGQQLRAELERMREHLATIPLQHEGRRRTVPKGVARAITALENRMDLLPILERYEQTRLREGRLDFSDQIALAARVAREVPAARELARGMHRVVLLDEFQDTSVAQLELLSQLFGAGHPTIAVGDPQQAIYGWRGASAASLTGFARAFARTGEPVLQRTLSTSWRNDEAVLAVANTIAAPLRSAAAGIDIPELSARPGAGEGAVEIIEASDERREARAVADWILQRRAESDPAEPPTAAVLVRVRRQIAVLAEELTAAGLEVEVVGLGGLLHRPEVADVRALLTCAHDPGRGDALMRLLTGSRFRLGARDIAVLGRWRDRLAARRREGQDEADEVGLIDAVDDLPPRDWTDRDGRDLSETARGRLEDLQAILRRMRRLLALPVPDLVTAAIQALGLDLELLERPAHEAADGAERTRALADLEALREHAQDFVRTVEHPTLGAYLALLEISEEREAGLAMPASAQPANDPAAVTIITMHSAKGLEWDLVAVVGLTEGTVPSYDLRRARTDETGRERIPDDGWLGPLADAIVPHALRGDGDTLPQLPWWDAETQVEAEEMLQEHAFELGDSMLIEDRRLMYVAVTRARRRLLLSSAAWRAGLSRSRPASRYLRETRPLVPERFQHAEEVPEENPLTAVRETADYPPAPGAAERARAAAARLLEDARAARGAAGAAAAQGTAPHAARGGETAAAADPLAIATSRVVHDLRERSAQTEVPAPARMSASAVVRQAHDPHGAALDLLRPLPHRPAPAARRGTAFHAWLEERYGSGALLELEDLAALADSADGDEDVNGTATASGQELAAMREAFEASEWARRTPIAVEEPVRTRVGGIAVRGIIDAVFADPEGSDGTEGVLIVDWKTGRKPSPARLRERAVQLTLYRQAWHERTGLPLERIRTAFHYVSEGITHEVTEHPDPESLARLLTVPGT